MRKLTLKKRDTALMVLFPALAVCFILGACTVPGGGVPEKQTAISITGDSEISVSWTDDEAYDGVVKCEGNKYPAECTQIRDGEFYRYTAVISGLEDGETYTYSVGNGRDMSKKASFCIDNGREEFSFLYIGDIQYQIRDRDYGIWGDFFEQAYENNKDISFTVFAGDMVEKNADTKDWAAFFENAEPVVSRVPMMTTVGNHETSITPETYMQMLALPENGVLEEEVYSFDYGTCHFISLNSCLFMDERKTEPGYDEDVAAVNQWLEQDLADNEKSWTVVYMHHPMYPVAEDSGLYSELRENWEPLFVEYGVDLVLCGHQHIYMRTEPVNGITYVMANSGEKQTYYLQEGVDIPSYVEKYDESQSNYVRVDVSKEKLQIVSYGEEHQELDRCVLEKSGS